MKVSDVKIRYNTKAENDCQRWRLIVDGETTFVKEILIKTPSETTVDITEDGMKHHITTFGVVKIDDGIATIEPDSILKTREQMVKNFKAAFLILLCLIAFYIFVF